MVLHVVRAALYFSQTAFDSLESTFDPLKTVFDCFEKAKDSGLQIILRRQIHFEKFDPLLKIGRGHLANTAFC